jgi:monoamine oxidase
MARTPLVDLLNRAFARAVAGSPHDDTSAHRGQSSSSSLSRRDLLRGAGLTLGAGAGLTLGSSRANAQADAPEITVPDGARGTSVAVVGAGLAGTHCALRLRQAGLDVTLFEASDRIGGRTFSSSTALSSGQVIELGGELINSDHTVMRRLAQEFGLVLDDRHALTAGLHAERIVIGGRTVTEEHLVEAWRPIGRRMRRDVRRMSEEALDQLSIAEWLDSCDDLDPTLRAMIDIGYTAEFGVEIEAQTLLNLRYLIDFSRGRHFRLLGSSDERFHTHAGNDSVANALAQALDRPVQTGHWLRRVEPRAGGGYQLTFDRDGSTIEHHADLVVLAIPQTTLRDVELALPEFPEDKRRSIDEVNYGRNSKLMSLYSTRYWATEHQSAGTLYADNGLGTGWDSSVGQPGAHGVWTNYVGGPLSDAIGSGTPQEQWEGRLLPLLEQAMPGAQAAYAGECVRFHWPGTPTARGSWLVYGPGQMSEFWGCEGRPVGNVFFCGEHTSLEYQGYMEGAAETGLRAAVEVIQHLGGSAAALDGRLREGMG